MDNYINKKQDYLRVIRAFGHSISGFIAAWKNEQAFRQEIILGLVLTPILYYIPITWEKKLILLGMFLFLLAIELLNSAVEAIADTISTEFHPLIKQAKDMASAAVLLALLMNVAAWIMIIIQLYQT